MRFYIPSRIIKYGINILSCALMVGCATAPPTQEMSDARQSVEAAESVGADRHAPIALDSAQHLLTKAEHDLEAGDFEKAQRDAIAAREAARQAVTISQAKQVQQAEQIEQKHTEPVKADLMPPSPPTTAETITYIVNKNDSLWKIAAKDTVYGDPWMWPLILKNNTNLITAADMIHPGLILSIETKPSTHDAEAAILHAKQRSPSSATKQQDSSYLNQHGLH